MLKISCQASVVKVIALLIESQTKKVVFAHVSNLPLLLSLGNVAVIK